MFVSLFSLVIFAMNLFLLAFWVGAFFVLSSARSLKELFKAWSFCSCVQEHVCVQETIMG